MDDKTLNGEQNVLQLDSYRKWKKKQEQEQAHRDYYTYPECRECVNMVQIDMTGYICGALEDANTGESFYVLKDGMKTVILAQQYWMQHVLLLIFVTHRISRC